MDMSQPAPTTDPKALARRALAAMDLTRLESGDPPERIVELCARAATPFGPPAAVCVYPEHVATARAALDGLGLQAVPVAAVANFPDGSSDAARTRDDIALALAAGASEIDVVMPWRTLLAGEEACVRSLLLAAREASGTARLKTIIESGELGDADSIRRASLIAIDCGADFIKTSTGKVPVNATLASALVMLTAIRDCGGRCGFKAAGGIRRVADAGVYFALADDVLGPDWATPARFRLGASGLLDDILAVLGGSLAPAEEGY
jgi:deoxyribose-phosphate aldolase